MTKIYFVRHCEALGNVMRIFQGSSDLDITEDGAKQLEYLEKRFQNLAQRYKKKMIYARKFNKNSKKIGGGLAYMKKM